MSTARYIIGFIVALFASSVSFLLALEAGTLVHGGVTLGDIGTLLFLSLFVVPFTLFAGFIIAIPVYSVGYDRGWFDTITTSALSGLLPGALFALVVSLFMGNEPVLWEWTAAGAVAGAVAGATWWAIVPPRASSDINA